MPNQDWFAGFVAGMAECEKARTAGPSFPGFEIRDVLGEGATAVVYLAFDRELQRTVALKVLRSGLLPLAEMRNRLRREARAVAALSHPHVVKVHDAREAAGSMYVIMEHVEGESLKAILRREPREIPTLVGLLEQAARGVHHAHMNGIVHRDVKPANILVTARGEARIADFGLSHLPSANAGTPSFMAPEQVEGPIEGITARTDVYALGAILYEIIAGHVPHRADTSEEMFKRILESEPPAPAGPRSLAAIAGKALSKKPAGRYESAEKFADDLRRHLDGRRVTAVPSPLRRSLLPLLAAILGVAGLLVAKHWSAVRLESRVLAIMDDADRAARDGDPARGRTFLDEGLSISRGSGLHFLRGRMLAARGQRDEAVAEFSLSGTVEARVERGLIYVERYGSRLMWYRAVAQASGFEIATVDIERRRPELVEALRMAKDDLQGDSWNARFGRAELLRFRGDSEGARAGLEAVIQGNPTHANAMISLARIACERGQVDRALQLCGRAIELTRGFPTAFLMRGLARTTRIGKDTANPEWEAAWTAFRHDAERALAMDEGIPEAHYFRGTAIGKLAELQAGRGMDPRPDLTLAVQALRRSLELSPGNETACNDLGSCLLRQAVADSERGADPSIHLSEAIAAFDQALGINPNYVFALNNRGTAWRHVGQAMYERAKDPADAFRRGVDDLLKAVEKRPSFSDAHNNLGNAYKVIAEHESLRGVDPRPTLRKAIDAFGQALSATPAPFIRVNLGVAWVSLGQVEFHYKTESRREPFEHAVSEFTRALGMNPKYAPAHHQRGRAIVTLAELESLEGKDIGPDLLKAIDDFTKALELRSDLAQALYWRGRAGRLLGEAERARGGDPTARCIQARSDLDQSIERQGRFADAFMERGAVRLLMADYAGAESDMITAIRLNPRLEPALQPWIEMAKRGQK